MSSISSAIGSFLTPPGTNQRQGQVNQQTGYAGSVYNNLWPGLSSQLSKQQSFLNSQLGNQQQGVQNAYFNTTQGGRNAETNAFGQQQHAMANEQAGQAATKFAGNPSLAKGFDLAAQNTANTNTGEYAGQVNSPGGQSQAWNAYSSALNQASPNYSELGPIGNTIYGQPAVPVGQGIGATLGALIPTLTGMGGAGNALDSLLGITGFGTGNQNTSVGPGGFIS